MPAVEGWASGCWLLAVDRIVNVFLQASESLNGPPASTQKPLIALLANCKMRHRTKNKCFSGRGKRMGVGEALGEGWWCEWMWGCCGDWVSGVVCVCVWDG